MNGKGDKPPPMAISREEFAANWDRIFGPSPREERRREEGRREEGEKSPIVDSPESA